MTALAPILQAFFTDRLARQRHASGHTIAAYRDTWRLLLGYTSAKTGTQPSQLDLADLDAPLIGAFLDHLETDRGNSPRTRNVRLAAIHSLFRYAALRCPEHAETIARVLAIPPKRFDKALVTWLTEPEIAALLAAPDRSTWAGRRDHALILLAAQTGLRISELTGLTTSDVHLGAGAHVSCTGKGRKQRITPLTATTAAVLRTWLAERGAQPGQPPVPHPNRRTAQPRRHRTPARETHSCRRGTMPIPERQNRHHAHAASHSSHEIAPGRNRHLRDRLVDGSRAGRDDADLPARRPRPERTSPRPDQAARRQTRTLPAARQAPRIPRSPLIMPTFPPLTQPPPGGFTNLVGIIPRSA